MKKIQSAVSLEEAKRQLRIEHDLEDVYIESLCVACTEMCEHEILRPIVGTSEEALADSESDVPASVKAWILLHVAELYRNREATTESELKPLPYLGALLDRHRRWKGGL